VSTSAPQVGAIDESLRTFNPKERRIAEVLAVEGKDVMALPESTIPNERSADALVAGRRTEFKSLDPGARSSTIRNTINQSIKGGGQARDIIIDARGSGLTHMEAERSLGRVAGITRGKLYSVRIMGEGYNLFRSYAEG
jgi:hypothetical protein